ncbi:holo-ACP synthase [Helicobacter cholecystus]|uniref:Holo-[acyl-carrier-protein] synthase n=1 Tax=Helicobacter cholecystus TaxID=45498 RepID=A0A3D8IT65_9HELI|nr:holo-ACP synthase [Helicobacter cholecystus]RDU68136.1 holo-ACP synthase [Helicobacter cholecystus]VEJ24391.1 holo-(acyl-carrier-protein) synthase [Helicobacter cholecystus]
MIGIDLTSISRIQKSYKRFGKHFLDRFLSIEEQNLCLKSDQSLNFERLASFWAIKEAISKALGVGIGAEIGFLHIVINKDLRGAPEVKLIPEKMKYFRIKEIAVSVTHDSGLAIASVMITKIDS